VGEGSQLKVLICLEHFAPVQDFQHLAQPAWARSAPSAVLQSPAETVSRSQTARLQTQADVEKEKEFVQAWHDWEQHKVLLVCIVIRSDCLLLQPSSIATRFLTVCDPDMANCLNVCVVFFCFRQLPFLNYVTVSSP
jgi:hypothetical protein